MGYVSDSSTKSAYTETWSNNAGTSSCARVNWHKYANFTGVQAYKEVYSMRRPRPKPKPVMPNEFMVHKYAADDDSLNFAQYCNTDNNHLVEFDKGIHLQKRTALMCHPQDLVEYYSNFTDNAKADVFAKANAPAIYDLAPVLAEMGETLMWVGGLFKGFVSLLKALWTLKLGPKFWYHLRQGLLEPESLWLEYRYAIMPMILTISEAIEAYKGGAKKTVFDARIERKLKHCFDDPNWLYNAYSKPSFGGKNDVVDTVTATARIVVKSQCDPSPLGVGMWDLLRGGYEVLPLSFVFNWFVGVEEWLGSLRDTKLEVESSYVTTVVNRVGHAYCHTDNAIVWNFPPNWTYHEYMMRRVPDIDPPKLPVLQAEKLSLLRTVDAISLVISFLKSFLTHKKK